MGACLLKEYQIVNVTDHPKKYWQFKINNYKSGSISSNRDIDAIVSTTTPDIHVPFVVFIQAVRKLQAKKTINGLYIVEENRIFSADDITFTSQGQNFVIKGTDYITRDNGKWFLHLRPSEKNNFVLGYPFISVYSFCASQKEKTLTFGTQKYFGNMSFKGKGGVFTHEEYLKL